MRRRAVYSQARLWVAGGGWREADAESGNIAALDVRTAGVGRGRPQCPQCKILVDSRGANRQNTQRAMRLGT